MKLNSNPHRSSALWLALAAALFSLTAATQAQNGTWINTAGGSWATAANWSASTIATGSGNTANFSTLTLGSAPTVTLDGARTIGNLIFGDVGNTYAWTLNTGSAGPLTLAVGSGTPTITVNGQTNIIGLVLAGTTGFTKLGSGTLSLSGQSTLTGTLTVSNGTLNLPTALSGGSTTFKCATVNLVPGTALTCVDQPFGWYGNDNSGGLTININGATCQPNGCFGVAYALTGGSIAGSANRLDLGGYAGFSTFVTSYPSATTSVINPGGGYVILRTDSGQTAYPFTVAAGTTASGIDLDVQGYISQNGASSGIVKSGAGVMRLDAAGNSYSGATAINAGTLMLASNATLTASTPITVAAGALFDVSTLNAGFFNLSSGRALAGGRTASPATDINGNLAVTSGTLQPAGNNVAGTLTINGNLALTNATLSLDLSAGASDLISLAGAGRTLTLNGTTTVQPPEVANGTYTLINGASSITGTSANLTLGTVSNERGTAAGAFTVGASAVTLTVSGLTPASLVWQGSANNGTWDVNTTANWLNAGSSSTFYNNDNVVFPYNPTTASISNSVVVYPASVTFSNTSTAYSFTSSVGIGGLATLTKLGSGTVTMWCPTNAYSGGTVISNGVLWLNSGAALTGGSYSPLGSGTASISGGTLQVNPGNSTGGTYTFPNAVTMNGGTFYEDDGINHFAGVLTINSGASANLIKAHYNSKDLYLDGGMAGSAAVTISAANGSYGSGVVHVTTNGTYNGAITVNNSSGLNGGLFVQANNAMPNASVDLETTASTDGYSSPVNVGLTIAGGASNVTLSGLTGVNTGSYVHNGDATTRTLTVSNAVANTYAGHLGDGTANGNNFNLVKTGAGALTLTGGSFYSGTTTVSGGTLAGNGILASPVTIQSGGTLAPGTATLGTLTVNNTLSLQGTASFRINKTGGTLTSDQIAGMTGVTCGGTLSVTNITSDGTPLVIGDTITLFSMSSGAFSGGFATLNLPGLSSTNLAWNTNNLLVSGSLSVIGVGAALPPLFSPAPGGFIGAVTVTLSATNTTIHYTTDGSNPTNSVTVQSAANAASVTVPVNSVMTIQAYTTQAGYANSAVVSATYATMSEGVWTNTAGGSWPISGNWLHGAVGTGAGITADFSTLTLTSNLTVTLDGTRTIGTLLFADAGNAHNWTLNTGSAGPLTLAAGTNLPVIAVSSVTTATIGAVLATSLGLVETGIGTLSLSTAQSYSAPTIVSNGILSLAAFQGLNNSPLTICNGATVRADANNALQYHGAATLVESGGTLITSNGITSNCGPGAGSSLTLQGGATLASGTPAGGYGSWTINTAGYLVTVAGGRPTAAVISAQQVAGASSSTPLTFNVADVTGDAGVDLLFSGTLGGSTYASGFGILKTGAGTMELDGVNAYTGTTTVSNGTLLVNGSLPANTVAVAGGMLGGTGTINGAVTVQPGGTLAPGTTNIGTLNIANTLTLAGTSVFRISKTGGTFNDQVTGLSGLTAGGSLVITNVTTDGTLLAAGDIFNLFNSSASGLFTSISLPPLPSGSGLSWDTTALLSSGYITIDANAGPPTFSPPAGSYVGATPVTISSTTPGATIYYTLDGTTPTISSPSGITPVTVVVPVNTNLTIQAYASITGETDSSVQSAAYMTIATPVWTNPGGGSWPVAGNWLAGIVANGVGMTADFSTLSLGTSPALVTLDEPVTIGNLILADQANASTWDLEAGTGGPLTLNAGTNTPTITVSNSATTIGAIMTGTNGLIVNGAGALTLTTNETYTGNTTVNGGILNLSYNSGGSGTLQGALTVNSNATVITTIGNALGYSGSQWVRTINLNSGTLETSVANSDNCWGATINMLGGTLASTVANGRFSMGDGPVFNVTGTNVASVISANLTVRDASPGGIVFNVTRGATASDLDITGNLLVAGTTGGITLNGNGITVLSGANTYTGATTVSNGTLVVDGTLAAASAVTVQTGATLGGNGTINGPVTVNAGGKLTTDPAGINTLTLNNTLSLAGTVSLRINSDTSASDLLQGPTAVTYGGALTVTNLGSSLALGNTFTLFSAGSYSGAFTATNLPGGLPTGTKWNWDPSAGVLSVVSSGPSGPGYITNSISGSILTLTWPADQGWRLVGQTNSASTGLGATWTTVSGPGVSNGSATITVDPTQPTVFYKLEYP